MKTYTKAELREDTALSSAARFIALDDIPERDDSAGENSPPDGTVTVEFQREERIDEVPDLSYLWQDYTEQGISAEDRQKYQAQDRARVAAYDRGEWHMVGICAVARITVTRGCYSTIYTIHSAGLWGIESDSDETYKQSVFEEECANLRADLEAFENLRFA